MRSLAVSTLLLLQAITAGCLGFQPDPNAFFVIQPPTLGSEWGYETFVGPMLYSAGRQVPSQDRWGQTVTSFEIAGDGRLFGDNELFRLQVDVATGQIVQLNETFYNGIDDWHGVTVYAAPDSDDFYAFTPLLGLQFAGRPLRAGERHVVHWETLPLILDVLDVSSEGARMRLRTEYQEGEQNGTWSIRRPTWDFHFDVGQSLPGRVTVEGEPFYELTSSLVGSGAAMRISSVTQGPNQEFDFSQSEWTRVAPPEGSGAIHFWMSEAIDQSRSNPVASNFFARHQDAHVCAATLHYSSGPKFGPILTERSKWDVTVCGEAESLALSVAKTTNAGVSSYEVFSANAGTDHRDFIPRARLPSSVIEFSEMLELMTERFNLEFEYVIGFKMMRPVKYERPVGDRESSGWEADNLVYYLSEIDDQGYQVDTYISAFDGGYTAKRRGQVVFGRS